MTDSPGESLDPEAMEDRGSSNPAPGESIGGLIAARLGRRAALLAGAAALLATPAEAQKRAHSSGNTPDAGPSSLTFPELRHQIAEGDAVAEGHAIQTVIRWGDPILAEAPEFDPQRQTPEAQARQFGYNCDYLDFFPLPRGSRASDHGLLVVNHEYTIPGLMFPGLGTGNQARRRVSEAQARVEMAAHGGSVVEVKREASGWVHVRDSRYNRRITLATPMRIAGPAAGHPRLRTSADPGGTQVLGMLNNCAGGNTPWGTVLTAEENTNFYFSGEAAESGPQAAHYRRYGIQKQGAYAWAQYEPRFNLDREPNEPNRFGWVVEYDPYDPASVPVKRTALGRLKHEGATHAVSADGRVAFYSGDDERFEYLYKFVTARPWNPADPAANRDLLDEGTLHVARFEADGRMRWLPLVHGEGPLTAANGFASQADVVIEARRAADLLGATPMDRPEDVETNPVNGRVYVMLTNNNRRTAEQVSPANPRPRNIHGHVVEIIPPGAGTAAVDHAATEARWEVFLAAGKPGVDPGTQYHRATSDQGWLSCPDNCTFDSRGRIWISTDGADDAAGIADGLYAADTAGPGRALSRCFYQAPIGAEVCGPTFTPDDTTLFLAIQHPGESSGSHFDAPSTRWPDFVEGMPPRPSVIAITRIGGGKVG
ncbi:dTDP-glucose 4,6-dehydratase [Siccirubricoccus deserti]|uniref:PhoX family phosphatase n=1 Tax=Siccirubricoccus deserti TaxID=2013562 RepID=A0A9X0QUU7_9PROT|nr:PhoX family phosphatase [Siccirubricoccus deserti]MBC4014294.1 PhoX family phosphatase [Siccirubricoccus deserti]GGC28122.1 dTDP-glucose 4,6-dehydratase [Siccirubricoccus deserti]